MSVPDSIRREMVIPAAIETVWAALTEPAQVARWFGTRADIDLRPGGRLHLGWDSGDKADGEVEVVEPPHRFVFRWRPFENVRDIPVDPNASTLVAFELEQHPDGTRLTLTETGFAALDSALSARKLTENEEGWDSELADLRAYILSTVTV